jgi:hypothetical protein
MGALAQGLPDLPDRAKLRFVDVDRHLRDDQPASLVASDLLASG